MKRPKQQSQAFSFLSFFTRKPKSDPKSEKPAAALSRDEVVITLTPNDQEHAQNVRKSYNLVEWSYISTFCSLNDPF